MNEVVRKVLCAVGLHKGAYYVGLHRRRCPYCLRTWTEYW